MKQTHKCLYVMRLTTSPPSEDRTNRTKEESLLTMEDDFSDDESLRSMRVFLAFANNTLKNVKIWTWFEKIANFNPRQIARCLSIREYPGDSSKSNRSNPDLVFSFEYFKEQSLRFAHIGSETRTLKEVDSNLKYRGYWCISFNEYDLLFIQMTGINIYKNGVLLKAIERIGLLERARCCAILDYPFVYFEETNSLYKLNVSNESFQIQQIAFRNTGEFIVFNGKLVISWQGSIKYLNQKEIQLPPKSRGQEAWGTMGCSEKYLLVSASDSQDEPYTNRYCLFDQELQFLSEITVSCEINQWVRRLFGTDFNKQVFFLSCRWYYFIDLLGVNKYGKLVLCNSMKASDSSIETAVKITANEWLLAGYSQENLIRFKIGWNSMAFL